MPKSSSISSKERLGPTDDHPIVAEDSLAHRIAGVNLEWSEDHGRTSRMGRLSYFGHFLEATGLFEDFVAGCPFFLPEQQRPEEAGCPRMLCILVII